jgi:predicted nucleic acid-binding protein
MIGLDCNILVQLALTKHPANIKTVAAVELELQAKSILIIPAPAVAEFLHVVTDPRRFDPPLSMFEAIDWIEKALGNPRTRLLEPGRASIDQTLRWMRQFSLGRKRILDTQMAALLYVNGVGRLLTSNPADFAVFHESLEVVTP